MEDKIIVNQLYRK